MGINTGIPWTDATWNPWMGCHKVSPGCKACYMYRDMAQYGMDPYAVKKSKTKFRAPLQSFRTKPKGSKVFTCSWSDWFHPDADEWRPEAWDIINATSDRFIYQILTKRDNEIQDRLPRTDRGKRYVPGNVWLGVSAETDKLFQERWDRMSLLSELYPGTYWVSLEPMLEALAPRLQKIVDDKNKRNPNWVVVGGESGFNQGKFQARPCELQWIKDVVGVCQRSGISVFVKQVGSVIARQLGWPDMAGGDPLYWPSTIRIQEFPQTIF